MCLAVFRYQYYKIYKSGKVKWGALWGKFMFTPISEMLGPLYELGGLHKEKCSHIAGLTVEWEPLMIEIVTEAVAESKAILGWGMGGNKIYAINDKQV